MAKMVGCNLINEGFFAWTRAGGIKGNNNGGNAKNGGNNDGKNGNNGGKNGNNGGKQGNNGGKNARTSLSGCRTFVFNSSVSDDSTLASSRS